MASTQITVENLTLIPVYALLTFADGHIGAVAIETPTPGEDGMYDRQDFKSGSIPCEYVWYDLKVLDPDPNFLRSNGTGVVGGYTYAEKRVRGGTSWIFEPAPLGGHQLRER